MKADSEKQKDLQVHSVAISLSSVIKNEVVNQKQCMDFPSGTFIPTGHYSVWAESAGALESYFQPPVSGITSLTLCLIKDLSCMGFLDFSL